MTTSPAPDTQRTTHRRRGHPGAVAGHPVTLARLQGARHLFTLSGFLWALLAMLALLDGRIGWMWLWLGIAALIDGVDGFLARKARVKEIAPWFDGTVVDIVVDYLTWTFIPVLFMLMHLPLGPKPVAIGLAVLILVSSMFCYANENWKSTDYYFIGFPAAWNVIAVMLYVLALPASLTIAAVLVFVVLTLVPTHYTHPFRVERFMALNIISVLVWMGATAWMVAIYPARPVWLLAAFWISGGWFAATCILRDIRGRSARSTAEAVE